MSKKVTISDVAKLANVAPATVSRVLNNTSYVSAETRRHVEAAIKQLQFIPDASAQSLKTNSTHTIGFLVPDISNAFHSTMARAIEDIVSKKNYMLLLCSTNEDRKRELTYLKSFLSKNVDALILNSTGYNERLVYEISQKIPTILVNRRVFYPNLTYDFFDIDGYQGSYLLTKQLLKLGHRKIFVIHGPRNLSNSQSRLNGFRTAMKDEGIVIDESYPFMFDGHFTCQGGIDAVEYLCSLSDTPTAILSQNNFSTEGVLKAFREKNIVVPDDISLVSHNELSNWDSLIVRPTYADFDTANIAATIGHRILARLENPSLPTQEFLFPPKIIPGNSVTIPTSNLTNKLHHINR
jgi:LacI family transcriptional regulator